MRQSSKTTAGRRSRKAMTRAKLSVSHKAALRRQVQRLEAIESDLRTTTEKLRRELEETTAEAASKSQFLATMSHELRTPLNAIIGFSEILKDEILGPIGSTRYRDYAANIHRSGAYLLDLVNELLDFAKLDAGKLELFEEPVDVCRVVSDCIQLMEPQARKASVQLRATPPATSVSIKADDRRLRQILLNLLSNAVKFTPEGGQVTVSLTLRDARLVLAVADTGIGIAAEDIPRALERFGQIDSSLSRKHQGTGLGLPLAKHLAELHGADFAIESELGVGTTISVLFPGARILAERHAA